jgi:CheY-like chemotaxis protein
MDKLHLTRSTVPPALILLDMLMPVMEGQTFLNRARQDHVMKDVPIVVATGDPSLDAPGASAVLTKPIRPERLLGIVAWTASEFRLQHRCAAHPAANQENGGPCFSFFPTSHIGDHE